MARVPGYILVPAVAGFLGLAAMVSPRYPELIGAAAAVAGGLSVLRLWRLRHQCDALADAIRGRPAAGGALTTDAAELAKLTSAVNDAIGHASTATSTAALRAKEMELRLRVADAERQHAEAIIHSISDAVVVSDAFDELVMANQSAARAFDFDLATAERSPVAGILKDPRLFALIREMRQQGGNRAERRVVEHVVKTPSGAGRAYQVTLSTVADAHEPSAAEAPAGVVAVLHDMTREKELAEMKNDFVSNVSHELRTPLASIKAYVEMLVDGEAQDPRTQREFYDVIQNEANRLGRLIDDILNISRIESGLVKLNKEPQSPSVIVKEAVEVIVPQAAAKNITVSEQLAPIFYQAVADRDMLYQAVLNLLSNAVKYTPDGGRVEARTEVDEARRLVTVRVIDNGVGIPPKDLPYVFDKFYRAEANNRMAKGTGLGLSLVKQIVETVHGGRIFVESQVGKGSTFGFELKLAD